MALTFKQLTELLTRELVPQSLRKHAYALWHELQYRSDVEAYLKRLDLLADQHPIDTEMAHYLACRPLGRALVSRVQGMDDAKGGEGVSFSQLKFQIRCFAELLPTRGGKRMGSAEVPVYSASVPDPTPEGTNWGGGSERNKGWGRDKRESTQMTYWVCDKRGHSWLQYRRRKMKGCAGCRSEGHRIASCAQR